MMIENIKLNKYKVWRKVVLFSATFFCLTLVSSACKKKKNPIGADALPNGSIMNSKGVDTFKIHTYTVEEDAVITVDPEFNLLGSYTDEVFGTMDAGFYTQLTLSGFSPDFGDLNTISIDSAVMAFEYGGYYGKLNQQLFEAYEITEELTRDSSYTRKSIVQTSALNLVPNLNNEALITPDPESPAIVGNDTLKPELRIPIDTIFARHLLNLAENATNNEDFLQNFKGLYFKVNNLPFFQGEGGILYLKTTRPASKLTVYYTVGGEQERFDFVVNGKDIDFNHVDTDFSGTRVQQVIDNHILGDEEYYAQALTTRAKVEFNSIDDIPKDVIIHSATLELPISYYQGAPFAPSSEVNASARLFQDDDNKYRIASAAFSQFKKAYVFDLRAYVQKVIKGEIKNDGIFISAKRFNTTAERIIFNGANSSFKKQPKLNIVYTKL